MIFIKNIIIMFVKKIIVFYYVDHCHSPNPKTMKILFLHDNTTRHLNSNLKIILH